MTEDYIWFCGITGKPMLASIRRESDIVWIRITRDDKFVSCKGYTDARAKKEIAKIRAKGIR